MILREEMESVFEKIDYHPKSVSGNLAHEFRQKFLAKFAPRLPRLQNRLYWGYFDGIPSVQCENIEQSVVEILKNKKEIFLLIEIYEKEIFIFENSEKLYKYLDALLRIDNTYLTNENLDYLVAFSDEDYLFSSLNTNKELDLLCEEISLN